MTVTNKQILALPFGLRGIGDRKMAMARAYDVALLKNDVEARLAALQSVQRQLFEQFGQKDAAGTLLQSVGPDGQMTTQLADPGGFSAAWAALEQVTQEISFAPLAPKDLGDAPIDPDTLKALGPFFDGTSLTTS